MPRSLRSTGPPAAASKPPSQKLTKELEEICKQTGAEMLEPGESLNLEKIQSKDGIAPKNRHQQYDQACRMEEQADEVRCALSKMSLDKRIEHSLLFKARGNDAFAARDFGRALKEYLGACWLLRRTPGLFPMLCTPASAAQPRGIAAIGIIDYDADDAANADDWALVARVTDLRRLAHLNIAAASLKLDDWELAEHVCGLVLASRNPTVVQRNKARFRLAKARDGKTDLGGALKLLHTICTDDDVNQAQFREARTFYRFLKKREAKQRTEWGGFLRDYASLEAPEPEKIANPPKPKERPYPVTHVRMAGDTRPLYEAPERTEEEKERIFKVSQRVVNKQPGESDLEADLRELKKGVDLTKPKEPEPEKPKYTGKELYPEQEMRGVRREARSDRHGREQRAHHINLKEMSEYDAKTMYDGLHEQSLEAEEDSNHIDAEMNKISPLARATLKAMHLGGKSKAEIRDLYEKARVLEVKRVQHCMAPDEREFVNDLVRRQHEFDDDALDLAFEEIRGDVLAREAAEGAKDEKRALLKKAQEDARKAADDQKLVYGSDARKKLRFEMIANACAPDEDERDWLVDIVTKMRKRGDPEAEVEDYIRERVKKMLEPALAASGQMCDIPVDIPRKKRPPPSSNKPASKLKGGFFAKKTTESKIGAPAAAAAAPPKAAAPPQKTAVDRVSSKIKGACRTEKQYKMAEEVQRMRDAGVSNDEISRRVAASMQSAGDPVTRGAAALAGKMKEEGAKNGDIQAALREYFTKHGVKLPTGDERE